MECALHIGLPVAPTDSRRKKRQSCDNQTFSAGKVFANNIPHRNKRLRRRQPAPKGMLFEKLCIVVCGCKINSAQRPILRDRSLFIARGGFWGITWFLGEQRWGPVVTENPKGEITENFGRIQSGSHSNFLRKWRRGGNRESHQMVLGGSLQCSKMYSKGESAKFHLV